MKRLQHILITTAAAFSVLPCGLSTRAAETHSVAMYPAAPLTARDKKQMADEVKQGQDAADQVAKQLKLADDKPTQTRIDQIGDRLSAVEILQQVLLVWPLLLVSALSLLPPACPPPAATEALVALETREDQRNLFM